MRFVNYATFVEDQPKLAGLLPEHASYLASLLAEGKLAAAGSFADGTGELQVYELDSAETARAVAAADPLAAGGAVAGSELKPWDVVMAGDVLGLVQQGTHYRRADVDGIELFYRFGYTFDHLELDHLRRQYIYGVADPSRVDPDNWVIDKALIDRPGVDEIMLDLLYDIRNNIPTFEQCAAAFRSLDR